MWHEKCNKLTNFLAFNILISTSFEMSGCVCSSENKVCFPCKKKK